MKKNTILFGFILLVFGCNLDDLHESLEFDTCTFTVGFEFSPTGICQAPCEISFTAEAPNATSYNWDFGDGSTSTLPNPTHTFMTQGDYLVKLTASDGSCTEMSDRTFTISTTTFEEVIQQGDAFDLITVNKVALANDGGYILVGKQTIENVGDYGFWSKTDVVGNLEESTIVGCCLQQNSQTSNIYDVITIPGTGYVICGSLIPPSSTSTFSFAMQIDEEGEETWFRFGADNSDANNIIETQDGGYLISGSSGISPNTKGYLLKLNALGQEEWSRTNINVDLVESVHETEDGIIAFGFNFGSDSKVFLLDDLGNTTSTITIPGTFSSSPAKMKIAEDGGYLILTTFVTSISSDSELHKYSNAGVLEWNQRFSNVFLNETITHDDGTYSVCGSTRPINLASSSNAYLANLNATGQINWEEEFGGQESDFGSAFLQTDDDGYFIGGIDQSMSKTDAIVGDKGIYLIKTNAEGKVE